MMRLFGQNPPNQQTKVIDQATLDYIIPGIWLIAEEFQELLDALGIEFVSFRDDPGGESINLCRSNDNIGLLPYDRPAEPKPYPKQMEEVADALGDMSVTLTGVMVRLGITDTALLQEIDRNNLAKAYAGHLDKHGKFIKPKGHPKPNISLALTQAAEELAMIVVEEKIQTLVEEGKLNDT